MVGHPPRRARLLTAKASKRPRGTARHVQRMQILRSLAHRAAYTTIAIALLSLGVGAVGAIFAIVDVALLRPLPYADAGRLQYLTALEPVTRDSNTVAGLVPLQLTRWRSQTEKFAGIEGANPKTMSLAGVGEPEALLGMQVSAGLFALLGAQPAHGRAFTRDEEFASSSVAIISDEYWQRRMGGAAGAIGSSLTIDGVPRTIVGVMPKGFNVLFVKSDVYIPLALDNSEMASKFRAIIAVGRLKPGATASQAVTDLNRINDGIALEAPFFRKSRAGVEPLREALFGSERAPLLIIAASVLLLLIIASANVMNLTLSDGIARRQATMTRLALGASRRQIVTQRLSEALVLSLASGAIGLGIGRAALLALRSVNPSFFQGYGDLALDARAVLATLVIALVAGGLAVLPTAIAESRLNVSTLAGAGARSVGGRADRRVREFLLAAQVAVAIVLLLAASLLGKNLRALTKSPQGFEQHGLVVVKMNVPARYATPEDRAAYEDRIVDAVSHVPGVTAASSLQTHFSLGSSALTFLAIQGSPTADSTGRVVNIRHVMPGVFRVMQTRLLEGRMFEASDRIGSTPVAIVNASFAKLLLGGRAIGARLRRTSISTLPWMDVVGVVDDVKDAGVGVSLGPTVYIPYLQENQNTVIMNVIARLSNSPSAIDKMFKAAVWSVDPTQAVNRVAWVDDIETESAAQPRFQLLVVELFSSGALALVVGGIYALTLFSVLRRSREIAVRSALGATPRTLVGDAVWHGLRPVVIGMAAGLAGAIPVARVMQRALKQEFTVADAPQLLAVLAVLLAATAVAAYVPARRVADVPPSLSLQS